MNDHMPKPDSQSEAAGRIWQVMLTLVFDLDDRRREVCDALGMSFVRTKALRRLAARPMTMRELAEQLLIDRPYTTLVVDDLERRGLVVRTVKPEDRRSKIVMVTEAGRAAAEQAQRILTRPPKQLIDLDPDDLDALDRILADLAGRFEPGHPPG
jgi:DNA-binding MarR family transcriptional regulator